MNKGRGSVVMGFVDLGSILLRSDASLRAACAGVDGGLHLGIE